MDVLLDDPISLFDDDVMFMASAMWKYMTPNPPAPSVHDIVVGHYQANMQDDYEGLKTGAFLSTTVALHNEECRDGDPGAVWRVENYELWLDAFGLTPETDLSCDGILDFSSWGSGNIATYWDVDEYNDGRCVLVDYEDIWNVFNKDDYKRCVCYFFDSDEYGCPQETGDLTCEWTDVMTVTEFYIDVLPN